jgi:methyl-accepting chemotaxis protein
MSGAPSSSSMISLSRLRIGTRIYLGFGLVLVLLGALGTMAVLGLRDAGQSFTTFETISENTVRAGALDRIFVGLRRNVLAYTSTGNEEAAKRARDLTARMSKEGTELLNNLIIEARKAEVQAIIQSISQYAANFEIAAKLQQTRQKLVNEQMNVFGAGAQKNLSTIVKSAMADGDNEAAALTGVAEEGLMQARIHALRFLDSPDPKHVESFKEQDSAFRRAMATLIDRLKNPERKRLAVEAVDIGAKYAKALEDVTRTAVDLDTMVNKTMAGQADDIGRMFSSFVGAQRASLDRVTQETDASIRSTTITAVALAAGALVLGLVISFAIGRGIVRPVSGLTGGMKELAGGNFDVMLPGLDRADEVGEMARAVETFKVVAAEKAKREAEEKQAEEARRAAQHKADMNRLADEFESAVGTIVDAVSSASTELEAAAGTLTKTAEVTQELSGAVAAASEQASANVQSVASATEEMTSSVDEISRQVLESARIAGEAVKQAGQTDVRINALSQAAGRIGDVVKLITAIAEQTNLLALNATIEAARAGEAGRGFAVVASEVKALAAQTSKATEEIGAQITGMQTATQESVAAIKEIGSTIGRISQIASTIAAAVEEQGAATQEIARNVGEAAKGTAQVATNITNVNRGAGETGSASAQVLASAQSLSSESNHLKAEVDKFLTTVRAA